MRLLCKGRKPTTSLVATMRMPSMLCLSLAVHRLSLSSSFVSTTKSRSAANRMSRDLSCRAQHRILCYGDSLTAGTADSPWELYPYAPHLEKALNTNANGGTSFVVRHRGMPGWTAEAMVDAKNDPSMDCYPPSKASKIQHSVASLSWQVPMIWAMRTMMHPRF